MSQNNSDIVIDDGRAKLSDLWKKEDYWAIWLGFILLGIGLFIFICQAPADISQKVAAQTKIMEMESQRAPFKTIEYYTAQDAKKKINSRGTSEAKYLSWLLARPGSWKDNPLDSFYFSEESAKAANQKSAAKAEKAKEKLTVALTAAKSAQQAAVDANFADTALNTAAEGKIGEWRAASRDYAKASAVKKATNLVPSLLLVFAGGALLFGAGMYFMGHSVRKFALGFIGVFAVTVLAFMMGSQSTMKYYGVGSEAWAIIIGMLIANTIGTPKWMKPALQTEYFIKTGLVLLGAEVLFDKIVAIGIPGIFVAWVVTPTVLICTYIFGQRVLKIPSKTLNITISADMSVCGTSAAIATATACRAKKEELTLAVGLSLIFTAIMMVVMPAFIKAVGIPEVLGGAWIGGTVDSTGAVAAAGAFLGEKAMYVAATIKMIQNVLIGVTAFGVAVYWTTKVEPADNGGVGRKVGAMEIWNRFPKFVLGFLGASIIASLISNNLGDISNALLSDGLVRGMSSPLRSWCFALAFTAIGLGTNFRELSHYFKGGKPLILYVCGQSFNLLLTLIMAYIMFYKVFPEITAKI